MMSDADIDQLISAAVHAMQYAHSPYSRFAVGAAVWLNDGSIVVGSNFENASYGLSLCAETVALVSANAQGKLAEISAIAVVGQTMDHDDQSIIHPCGRCRQIINEAEQIADQPIAIYCATPDRSLVEKFSIATLLPHAFGPADLGFTSNRKN